ncbi:Fic family protein [Bifidobacterium sp. SO1]|uniref:Fic family protein n=1 Tax=Bifidobacterium sp. SO1 TaxID=2809029 RepID=UPI001F0B4340|nr:Fic family protein [Bifidobacterium sp. SO1]
MPHKSKGLPQGTAGTFDGKSGREADSDITPPASQSPLRTVKGLARLLYRMGRTFDGLNTSRLATEDFLRTGNPKVIGSRNDYDLLRDLRDASSYVLDTDWNTIRFDLDWFTGINARMTRTAAMQPGVLRDAENVIVGTKYGTYTPPVPDPKRLTSYLNEAASTGEPPLTAASRLFARLAKAQPFGDGNKRSALLAANGLLIRAGETGMLAVPVEDPDRAMFNDLLGAWYLKNDPTVIDWLAEWNQAHPGD